MAEKTRLSLDQMPLGLPVKEGLPEGMELTADGVMQGNPTEPGIFVFTVKVTDGEGSVAYRRITLAVH